MDELSAIGLKETVSRSRSHASRGSPGANFRDKPPPQKGTASVAQRCGRPRSSAEPLRDSGTRNPRLATAARPEAGIPAPILRARSPARRRRRTAGRTALTSPDGPAKPPPEARHGTARPCTAGAAPPDTRSPRPRRPPLEALSQNGGSAPATAMLARTSLRRRPRGLAGGRKRRGRRGRTPPPGGAGGAEGRRGRRAGPEVHLQTVIKFRLSTAALRDGTLFLRAEAPRPPRPRDAISSGGSWSRRSRRGAFVPGLPGWEMPLSPPPAEEEEAPAPPPLRPPAAPRGSSALRQAAGRARRRRGPRSGGGSAPPPAGSRAATALAAPAPQSAGAVSQWARGKGAARRRQRPLLQRGARR